MIYKLSVILISAAVLIATYFYVPAQKDGPTKKSMILKMACATAYILSAVIGSLYTKEFSDFDRAMLLAFIMSWTGDLFLHMHKHKIYSVIGFAGFLSSHICFIRAYIKGINQLNPGSGFFSVPLIILIVISLALFTLMIFRTNMPMLRGPLIIPVLIYGGTIVTMFYKASELGFYAYKSGIGLFVFIAASLGALLFVASDFSISILIFNKGWKKNLKLKYFNMYTYFGAQLLLSTLTYFI